MRRLTIWIEANRKKAWFAVGLNVLVLAIMLLLMVPSFESNDDITMSELVNGALGVHDAHLVFQNYLLGLLYKALYTWAGSLAWYSIVQYVFLLIAFSVVTYVILQRVDDYSGLCVCIVLLIFFAYECYFKLQFTKTAGVVGAAAVFLLFYAVSGENVSWKMILFGELLGCVGSMFRYRQFLACGAMMGGIGIYFLLELKKKFRGQCVKRLALYAVTFGSLVLLAYGFHVIDKKVYNSDAEWAYYMKFTKSRAQLQDRGFPDYDTYEEAYQSLGLNYDAYILYRGLDINDPDKFSLETMQELVSIKPKQMISGAFLKRFLKDLTPYHFETPVFYCFLVMFLFWLFWGDHKWRTVFAVLAELFFFEIIYFYMFYDGRYLINRVDVGLWFAASLVMLWFLRPEKVKLSRRSCIIFCLIILILNQRSWNGDWRINSEEHYASMKEHRETLESLSADKEHLYLAKVIGTISGSASYGPFDQMPAGLLDNICWLGGWEINTAPCRNVLDQYGIRNPYKDMVGNENVRLIDNNIELTMRYIRTYYNENAKAVCVGKIGSCKIYQIEAQ